jgi:hypothetical protein
MRSTSIYEACRFKCSCHPYKYGEVIHSWGVRMNNCLSWVCLRCFQAHVSFFDVTDGNFVQIHDETFACIDDLPECLRFVWQDWDDDGRLHYWGDEMTDQDEVNIIQMRRKLDLPELEADFYQRIADALRDRGEWALMGIEA